MSRYFKFLLLAILAVTLMASSAIAGTVYSSHQGGGATNEYTISVETLGTNRSISIMGGAAFNDKDAGNFALAYAPAQALTSGNLIRVSFTGAAFNGDTVSVCLGSSNGKQIGQATPSAGTTSQDFQIDSNVGTANFVYFTTAACNGVAGAGANVLAVRINSTTSTGNATASISALTSGGSTLDAAATANIARIRSEYTVNLVSAGAANHTVDYLGTPGNGSRIMPGTVLYASTNSAANIARTVNTFNANNGANNANLTVGAVVSLTDTANWQGLSKVFLAAVGGAGGTFNGTCTDNAGGNLVGTGSLSGTLSLTVPTAGFNGANNADLAVCLMAGGNSLSIPRTIQASVDVNVTGTGANDPAASSFATIDTWDTNAYQALIPWSVNSSTVPTYCLINNNDTSRTASVLLDVLSSEDGVTVSNTLGTVAPKTSKLLTLTADSAQIDGSTAVSLSSLGAGKRYAPKITVTANPNNVSISCIQTDPVTNGKRAVPVLTNSGWVQ